MVPEMGAFDGAPRKSELPSAGHEVRRELDGHLISGEFPGEGHPPYELSGRKALRMNWR